MKKNITDISALRAGQNESFIAWNGDQIAWEKGSTSTGKAYYISPTGNDNNDGRTINTPWQTLSKVNSTTFQPGDKVLFKRGGSWTGTLHPLGSGSSNGRITLSAYGATGRYDNLTISLLTPTTNYIQTFTHLEIEGPTIIEKPSTEIQSYYFATRARDQCNRPMFNQNTTWEIAPAVSGVSINSNTGEITVSSTAAVGRLGIKATCNSITKRYSTTIVEYS